MRLTRADDVGIGGVDGERQRVRIDLHQAVVGLQRQRLRQGARAHIGKQRDGATAVCG